MAEQQLVDYIKKAKDAGQTDEQSKSLLLKNGWTEAEIRDAFAASGLQSQPIAQTQPKPQVQPTQQPAAIQPDATAQEAVQSQVASKPSPNFSVQPRTQLQDQPQVVDGNPSNIRKKSHIFAKLFIVLIIIVILGGVGLYAAAQYGINLPWNPFSTISWNPLKPNHAEIISKMLTAMKDVKSRQTTINGEVSAIASTTPQSKLTFSITSKNDTTDANNPKGDATFLINYTEGGSTLSPLEINASMIAVDKALYVKLNNAVLPANSSYSGLDILSIKDKWLRADENSFKTLLQSASSQTGMPDVSFAQTDNSMLARQITDLVATGNVLTVSKQLGDQVISGHDSYHYLITIKKDKIKDLFQKILLLQDQGSAADASNSFATGMAEALLTPVFDAVGDVNMEIWIGKTDYMLYQVKFDKTIAQWALKFNMTNSDFNKPVVEQAPASAGKLEDVMLPLLKTQLIKADLRQIRVGVTSVFSANNSYSSLCYNGLLNGYLATYGPLLISLNNDIVKQGAKKPACFASSSSYCISTQLQDGTFLCVSNSNTTGNKKCLSAQTVCQ